MVVTGLTASTSAISFKSHTSKTSHRVRRDVKLKAVVVVVIAVGLMLWLSPLGTIPKLVVLGFAIIGFIVVIRLPEITRDE